jgi:tetratricopeptide (TPR) repeat protein
VITKKGFLLAKVFGLRMLTGHPVYKTLFLSKQYRQTCFIAYHIMAESPTLQNDPDPRRIAEKKFINGILPIITTLFENPDVLADYQGGASFLTRVLYLDDTDLDLDTRSKIRALYTKFESFMTTKLDPSVVTTPEILAKFYMHFGDCKVGLDRHEEALKEYEKVEALDDIGDDIKSEIYTKIGDIAVRFNQDDKAQMQYKKAVEIYKTDPEKVVDYVKHNSQIGECLMELKRWKEAISFQQKVIQDLPNLVQWSIVVLGHTHERQGRCYAKLKDYSNAVDHFIKAGEVLKNHRPQELMEIKGNLGVCWNHLKNYKNAVKSFRQGLEIGLEHKLDQPSLTAASFLAEAFDSLHEHKKSIKCLKFVVKFTHELHSNDTKNLVNIYQWRGINHLNVKEYDEGLEWFNRTYVSVFQT